MNDTFSVRKLKEELEGVYNADISTIHAFCSNLIKKYFWNLWD